MSRTRKRAVIRSMWNRIVEASSPPFGARERGWITPCVQLLVVVLTAYTRPFFKSRRYAQKHGAHDYEFTKNRARAVDLFILAFLLLEVAALIIVTYRRLFPMWLAISMVVITAIRCAGIPAVAIEVILIGGDRVLSRSRMLILTIVNYVELMVCFGVFYTYWSCLIGGRSGEILDGLHLSVASQLTIGYGEIYPIGLLRVATWCQGIFAMVVLGIGIARYVGASATVHEFGKGPAVRRAI